MEQMLTVTSEELRTRQIKLVEALESGAYAQGGGQLRDDFTGNSDDADKFCCLGVACDIYMKETGKGYWEGTYFHDDESFSQTRLPENVKLWFGFSSYTGGHTRPDGGYTRLDNLNDRGVPFSSIADIIDSNSKAIFHD